jgi:hypothetical protein
MTDTNHLGIVAIEMHPNQIHICVATHNGCIGIVQTTTVMDSSEEIPDGSNKSKGNKISQLLPSLGLVPIAVSSIPDTYYILPITSGKINLCC